MPAGSFNGLHRMASNPPQKQLRKSAVVEHQRHHGAGEAHERGDVDPEDVLQEVDVHLMDRAKLSMRPRQSTSCNSKDFQ